MVPVPRQAPDRAGGFVTTQFVLAVAFSLVLFVMLCNAIVYQYARGVVRAALDEGVRSGSRAGGTVRTCEAAAEEVRRSLLGGPVGAHVAIRCGLATATVEATATGYLPGWLPMVPDWPIDLAASAVKEPFTAPPTSTPASTPPASAGSVPSTSTSGAGA
ncbi:MAG TPA: hypothetical protein VFA45_02945 [Actinomycetes bacterium]|nr:hypothetical protein [Actinomycetes bacterium]